MTEATTTLTRAAGKAADDSFSNIGISITVLSLSTQKHAIGAKIAVLTGQSVWRFDPDTMAEGTIPHYARTPLKTWG